MPASRHALPAGKRMALAAAVAGAGRALIAAAPAAPAQAPESRTPPPGGSSAPATARRSTAGRSSRCSTARRRQLLVSVAVRPAADGKTGAMLGQLPLGLNLTEPVACGSTTAPREAGDPDLHQCRVLRRHDA